MQKKPKDESKVDCEETNCFFAKEVGKYLSHVCLTCTRNKLANEGNRDDYRVKLVQGGY